MPILGIMASSRPAFELVGSYDSLATVTLSAATASVTFTGIPTGYKHLQIRALYETVTNADNIGMTLNGSTVLSRMHYIYGNGSSAIAGSSTDNLITLQAGVSTTSYYGMVIDILDYQNTNKNKTVRVLGGADFNGSGIVYLSSGLYSTTSAVSSLSLQGFGGQTIAQYSQFALYGVK
jgi:hypothetical protein